MSDPNGFMKYQRLDNPARKISERINDFSEITIPLSYDERLKQASRCMNCGIPFCHQGIFYGGKKSVSGCPNNNLIPEWNDFLSCGDIKSAFERLSRTNPLAEMTGRVCPAPCEASCTENLYGSGITIHDNECFIIDTAWKEGWVEESGKPTARTDFKVAVVGSGPAGLSCAWRLNQLGHQVTVFEKNDRCGGLLMYGIPNMKLDKKIIERRLKLMEKLGVEFSTNTNVGVDKAVAELEAEFDRIILTIGSEIPRDLLVTGRNSTGIEFAVDFLTKATKDYLAGVDLSKKLAGKKVVVIGGGDTGNDCLATSIRQGAASVTQLEIMPLAPTKRAADNLWPEYPLVAKMGYGQEEAQEVFKKDITLYSTATLFFLSDQQGQVTGLEVAEVDLAFNPLPNTKREIPADLVLLALGFVSADQKIFDQFGIQRINDDFSTTNEKVYVAGDARRGASLVIWGIYEGRMVAEKVDEVLRMSVKQ